MGHIDIISNVILLRLVIIGATDTPYSTPYQSVNSVSHFRAYIIHCLSFPVRQ